MTAYAIERSLDTAFKNAKLDQFERFVNEAWTSERLRVLILGRVLIDLPLFDGNNRGRASMEALDGLIQRAAEATYRRIFETLRAARSQQKLGLVHAAPVSGA